jgi:carbonic anhydrase
MKTSTLHFLVGTALTFDAASAVDSDIFNYDPNSPKGPEFWKDIALENNQCGGTSNSPIALESMPCTMFEDYKFEVRTRREGQ